MRGRGRERRKLLSVAVSGVCAFCVWIAWFIQPAFSKALEAPYDIIPASAAESVDEGHCPSPRRPPGRMIYRSMYEGSDSYRATVNPEAREEYMDDTAGLRAFENALLRKTNAYLRYGSVAQAHCALDWLYSWAKAKALLVETNPTGAVVRHWALASFASAFAQIKDERSLDKKKKKKVRKWLSLCARRVMKDYPGDSALNRHNNNHLYWAAWSVAMTGIALGKEEYYEWGLAKARHALESQVGGDGTLPLEMARGPRAMHYHVIALMPLVLLAEAGARNGDDIYAAGGGSLPRLVRRVVKSMRDDSYFKLKSGFEQEPLSALDKSYFGWMEAYAARFEDPDIDRWLRNNRPVFARRAGGDMTFLYARPGP